MGAWCPVLLKFTRANRNSLTGFGVFCPSFPPRCTGARTTPRRNRCRRSASRPSRMLRPATTRRAWELHGSRSFITRGGRENRRRLHILTMWAAESDASGPLGAGYKVSNSISFFVAAIKVRSSTSAGCPKRTTLIGERESCQRLANSYGPRAALCSF